MNNKLIIKTLIFLFMVMTLSFCNCKSKCGEPGASIDEKGFSFRLIEKSTGESMIALWGAVYNSDKVSLIREDSLPPHLLLILENGHISFPIEDSPTPPVGEVIEKILYLKLPDLQGVPDRDIDTLRFEYKLQPADCLDFKHEYFKAFYNDSLHYSGEYTEYLEFSKK